jgi:hypothetical protein
LSSRGPTCARPVKDLRTSSLFGSSPARPHTGPRSQKRLDWHTCMPPVDSLHSTPSGVTGIHNTPEPSGARCSANCARRTSVLQPAQGYRHRVFSGRLTERLQDAHRVPPGTHGISGFHRTPPGVHGRPRALTGGPFYAAGPFEAHLHDLRLAGTTSVVRRCEVFATSASGHSRNLRVPPGPLRRPDEASLSILAVPRR